MRVLLPRLAAFFLLLSPLSGGATHPYLTDDTGTQGAGNWQLELMAEQVRHASSADTGAGQVHQVRRAEVFNPVLTYGMLEGLDAALGLNGLRQRTTENGIEVESVGGVSDSTLELKWRFWERDGMSLALKPGLILPTGDENRGLGIGRVSWGVGMIATREAKPWVFLANIAYTNVRYKRPEDVQAGNPNLWRASAGFWVALSDELRAVGETGVRTNFARNDPFRPGQSAQFAMLGLIYSPSDRIDLDVGVRRGLNRAEFDSVVLIGATFRW